MEKESNALVFTMNMDCLGYATIQSTFICIQVALRQLCAVHSVHFPFFLGEKQGRGQMWEAWESHTPFPNFCVQTTNDRKSAAFTVSVARH